MRWASSPLAARFVEHRGAPCHGPRSRPKEGREIRGVFGMAGKDFSKVIEARYSRLGAALGIGCLTFRELVRPQSLLIIHIDSL